MHVQIGTSRAKYKADRREVLMEVYVKRASLIAALCVLFMPIVGLADQINFNGAGGSVTVSGGATISASIPIVQIVATGTPLNSGTSAVTGTLTFSGTEISATPGALGGETYLFGLTVLTYTGNVTSGGSSITMTTTGGPPLEEMQLACGPGGTGSECSIIMGGTGLGVNKVVSTYLGLTNAFTLGLSGVNGSGGTNSTCPYTGDCPDFTLGSNDITLPDIVNGTPPVGSPEPGTLSLLGAGLIGLLGLGRRRS